MNELVLPLVVLGLAILEILLHLAMNRHYFSFGVPLYHKRVSVHRAPSGPPEPGELSTRLSKSVFVPLLFRRFSKTDYGFREGFGKGSFFRLSYPPLMHGFLTLDKASCEVVVTGYANLWMCAIFLYMGKQFLDPREPVLAIFFLVFAGGCYGVQLRRFGQVAEVAAEEWTKSTDLAVGGA